MSTQDNQRGGIVVFAIIGVLLAGLLAGGLYLSKQQGRVAQDNTPPTVAIDTEKEANETEDEAAPGKEEGLSPAPSQTQTQTPNPQDSTPQSSRPSVPVSGPSEVASTGPADTLLSVLVVTTVTFVGFVFTSSHARLRRSALSR